MHLVSMVLLVAIEASSSSSSDPPQAKPGCLSRCGNLIIPYPFGIGDDCYLREGFKITCDESAQPPRALLADSSIITTNISLNEGQLQIWNTIGHDCYDEQGGNQTESMRNSPISLRLNPPFTISAKNKFVAVGCDTSALFRGNFLHPYEEERYILACMSVCNNLAGAVNGSCSLGGSLGCCQIPIPNGLQNFTLTLGSFLEYKDVAWNFNRCSYSFIVEEGEFTFLPNTSFQELSKTQQLPMIVDWEIQDGGCAKAQKRKDYACKGISKCANRTINLLTEQSGYYCQCPIGFEGNPYLSPPGGCRGACNLYSSLASSINYV